MNVATTCEDNCFGCTNAEIKWCEDSATLIYRYQTGAPARQFFDKSGACLAPEHLIEIPQNSWASLEYNGRYACINTGTWWYEHVVVNVAVGEALSASVFTATKPIEVYSQLAKLR